MALDINNLNALMKVGLTDEQFEVVNNYISNLLENKDDIEIKEKEEFTRIEFGFFGHEGSGKSTLSKVFALQNLLTERNVDLIFDACKKHGRTNFNKVLTNIIVRSRHKFEGK